MVYCNGCGVIIATDRYCVECKSSSGSTPSEKPSPGTGPVALIAGNSDLDAQPSPGTGPIVPIAVNSDWKAQFSYLVETCASNAVSSISVGSTNIQFAPERKQCYCCLEWFPNAAGLDYHWERCPASCSEHGLCFRRSEIHNHGMNIDHRCCFVEDCPSKYRQEAGWTAKEIREHVMNAHSYSKRPRNKT